MSHTPHIERISDEVWTAQQRASRRGYQHNPFARRPSRVPWIVLALALVVLLAVALDGLCLIALGFAR